MKKNSQIYFPFSIHPVDIPKEWLQIASKVASKEELEEIVQRLKVPICSNGSAYETMPCGRYEDIRRFENEHRQQWPLWCGLERSKTVNEIVGRLYTPNKSRRDGGANNDSSDDDDETGFNDSVN